MRIDILTIFPELFESPLKCGVLGRAVEAGLVEVRVHNIRDACTDRHKTTDDAPFGGGAGMVMKIEPIVKTLEAVYGEERQDCHVVLLSASGRLFTQKEAREMAQKGRIVLICGRYEGVDERLRERFVDASLSVGEYVLSGGEFPALVIVDAVARLVPGVLGNEESTVEESFSSGLLEYPHYTRPRTFRGYSVPEVLLSGDHETIRKWRRSEALRKTRSLKPEVFEKLDISEEDRRMIEPFACEGERRKPE